MTHNLKSVILALVSQGFTKPQILDTLASEYWVDASVTRYLSTI